MAYGFNNDKSRVPVYESSVADTTFAKKIHTILGRYNIDDPNEDYAVIVGNGTSDNDKSNAFTIGWDGVIGQNFPEMGTNAAPLSNQYHDILEVYDGDGNKRIAFYLDDRPDGKQGVGLFADRLVNGNALTNGFRMSIDDSGNKNVVYSDPDVWCDALGKRSLDFIVESTDPKFITKKTDIDLDGGAPASDKFWRAYECRDKDNYPLGFIEASHLTNNSNEIRLVASRKISGTNKYNSLRLGMDSSGDPYYVLSSPGNFCSALNVGNRVTKDQSTSVTVATSSYVNICSVSLPAGTWAVFGCVCFPSNATGYRGAHLSTNSNAPNTTDERTWSTRVQACNGNSTCLMVGGTCVYNSTTTLYLKGYQNSGGNLSCTGSITAVRIK